MFFKKKEKPDEFLQDFEGRNVYNFSKKEFLMDFSHAQKECILRFSREWKFVETIAYTNVSPACMEVCMKFSPIGGHLYKPHNNVRRVDIWKTAQIFKTPRECEMVLESIRHGINIFKEFKDVRELKPEELDLIYSAALQRANICNLVRKKLPLNELRFLADKKVRRAMKWERLHMAFWQARNPEEF